MKDEKSFSPLGLSVVVAAAGVAPAGVQALTKSTSQSPNSHSFRIYNSGSAIVYLGYGKSASEAQTNSVAPTAGTGRRCIAIPPGAAEILTFERETYFSGLTSSAASVFVTPGEGV